MEHISNTQCRLLSEISIYHFCTVTHLRMITGFSASYLRECLGSLTRKKYLRTFIVTVTNKIRAESFYYLSEKGADFLITYKNALPEALHVATGSVKVTGDYFHRYHYISFCILLRQYAAKQGVQIEGLYSYFSKSGSNRKGSLKAQTHIPLYSKGKAYYVPDGVIKTSNGLYIAELYNDHSITRIINSLATNAVAISSGTPGITFGIAANPKVMAVFTNETTMKHVVKKLQDMEGFTDAMAKLFFFATLEHIKDNIGEGFKTIHDTPLLIT